MEACATAHHWARELITLGQEMKLMPQAYVKAYVPDHSPRGARASRRELRSSEISLVSASWRDQRLREIVLQSHHNATRGAAKFLRRLGGGARHRP